MNWRKSIFTVALASLMVMAMAGCGKSVDLTPAAGQSFYTGEQTTRPEGWTDETHSDNISPNYDVVFPQDKVNQLRITIASDDWDAMQANMTELLGAQGTGQEGSVPGAGGVAPGAGGVPPRGGGVPDAGA